MWCQLQHYVEIATVRSSCDLLKKLYLCGVNYNFAYISFRINSVVICLKSCIFVVSITTLLTTCALVDGCDLLKKLYLCGVNYNHIPFQSAFATVVICLKSCIFVVSITTVIIKGFESWRCDLLKKLYLCGVNYNYCFYVKIAINVVICLKSCIFVVSITTSVLSILNSKQLWFA